ncbi:MAG: hypothetical protein CO113_19580 [Elusimicrobia bacterium CG_4_9_14_3_um_filter_62_55]|nr:MAG: hypothetical protein COR54_16010 [Elusimicrobia bacterium CG22_combo_CG10-13_8_21_14_all_63_91]PJA12775.1 MAG: hypothetical protein COX66_16380 [Elusimicrobia bacterium CG_4_10_14_0_2_um_filter_63_34]PJB22991.1 MAG: hypothetical protein CO113_19580 [Elusimicrobia bacterium CG_4_9_14_3_um_filter_62_55]
MLDRCPGCAHEVSDTAEVCPECGFKFIADAPPANTHGAEDNDPILDPPASLSDDPVLDPPASQEFDNDDLLAIQTGSGLPSTYEHDTYEPPKRPDPPAKSQATIFVVAGLCIAAMALSSVFIKHQKAEKARLEAEAKTAAEADAAKARMAAERAAAEQAASLAKAAEQERLALAAAQAAEEEKAELRESRKRKHRSALLDTPQRRRGLPEDPAVIAAAQDSGGGFGGFEVPTTDSAAPEFGKDFRVKGTVYDLFTMKPIGEVDVVFSDLQSGKQLATVTDDSGGFIAHLPINGKGYTMKIRHSGYEPNYLEDSAPSFKTLPIDQRKSQAGEWMRAGGKTTLNSNKKTLIRRDFALIPK